jgi:hypothetical protein
MPLFETRLIPPGDLFEEIQIRGAASTKELKEYFGVDSSSIRRSLAALFAADAVWACTSGKAFYYMVNTGEKGRPAPGRIRAAAARGELPQPSHPLDFKGEMMKQVMVFNQVGWDRHERLGRKERAKLRETYSPNGDDEEVVELDYGS